MCHENGNDPLLMMVLYFYDDGDTYGDGFIFMMVIKIYMMIFYVFMVMVMIIFLWWCYVYSDNDDDCLLYYCGYDHDKYSDNSDDHCDDADVLVILIM